MPDLFFYRDPEEAEKEEKERWVDIIIIIPFLLHISWESRFSVLLPLEPMCKIKYQFTPDPRKSYASDLSSTLRHN